MPDKRVYELVMAEQEPITFISKGIMGILALREESL